MARPTGSTFVTYAKDLYYENIFDGHPRTVRLIQKDGDYLIGEVFGEKYKVLASHYQLARKIGEV